MSVPAYLQNYGVVQRTKPRLKVLRGWDPSNPTQRTQIAPIAAGVQIQSAQVCSLQWNSGDGRLEWSLGVVAATDIPYFATKDFDDYDVIASGGLTGLSSLDNLELQTGYFDPSPSIAYSAGVELKASTGTPGNVVSADLTAANTILGYLSRSNGPNDLTGTCSDVIPDANGQILVITLQTAFQRYAHN